MKLIETGNHSSVEYPNRKSLTHRAPQVWNYNQTMQVGEERGRYFYVSMGIVPRASEEEMEGFRETH